MTIEDASELLSSDDVLPESVEIKEKFANSDASEGDLSLDATQDLFNRFGAVGQPLMHVELLSEGVLVQIESNILEWFWHLRIGNDSLDGQCLYFVDVLDFLDEVLVANLLGVAAASVPSRQQVCQLLIPYQSQIVQYSNELFPGDQVAVGAVVVLKGRFDEDPLARHRPPNIVQNLLQLRGLFPHTAVVPQLRQISLSKVSIPELLIDSGHEVGILDEISGFDTVLVGEGLDFFCGEVEPEEAESRGESRDEFVLDAVSLPEFVVVLEEGLDADLLLPDLGADARLNALDRGDAVDGGDWVRGGVRDWVAACLKTEVISYILLLLCNIVSPA